MRRTREILRQKLEFGRSHREMATRLELSVGAVSATLMRAAAAGLSCVSVQGLSDEALDERLYGGKAGAGRPLPDCAYLHLERKKPGVTLELLHLEYLEKHPDGYRYTRDRTPESIPEWS
jgi:transposase